MNFSLKNRITLSFVTAIVVILMLSFTVFQYLHTLNRDIEEITMRSNRVALLTDEIRISAVSIIKQQRRILLGTADEQHIQNLISLTDSFTTQLQTLDSLYSEVEAKRVIGQMISYVEALRVVIGKSSLHTRDRDTVGLASISELSDKILDTFSEFQDIQYFQSLERDRQIKMIISETKRNMMITLIIGFLGTIVLVLVIPGKIALPFKKIMDAIRELQDNNFDVSIYYNQDDEIGEIAREMNKMIHTFKKFDELRTDRISVENRKFDALANLVRKPVMVANAEGKLIYMNNQLYSILQVRSEDVIGRAMQDSHMPETIIESYDLAIKRRSKIENAEIVIAPKRTESKEGEDGVDSQKAEDEQEQGFRGYANVIPIRGKDSSLDYYLMVLSKEVFL
jgi:PAS domain-containing protein